MRLAALILVAALSVAGMIPARALAETVAVLMSGQGGSYAEVVAAIRSELQRTPGVQVDTAVVGSPEAGTLFEGSPRLLIAVGTQATQAALRAAPPRIPLLGVLIPSTSYQTLVSAAGAVADGRSVSAVFLDQPPRRQIELIRQALPELTRVGLVIGPDSGRAFERLQAAAAGRGLSMLAERVHSDTELFPALQRVMAESEVFLALPDPRVVTPEMAQNLLITSYRMRRPVVGYSAAYVRAGALLAAYSTPAQSGTQAGEIARSVLRGAPLPAPQFPNRFSVSVNRQVARAFGLALPGDAELRDAVAQQESR